jgi:hypothetical protein
LGNLIYRLLLYVLQDGPRSGWEIVDSSLRRIFEAPLDILPLGQNIMTALNVLRTESWGDSGKELRVRARKIFIADWSLIISPKSLMVSFIRHCLPQLDAHALQAAKTAILISGNCEDVQELLDRIDERLALKDPQPIADTEKPPLGSWQTTVRQSVQDIVEPTEITWMEDDDRLSESNFADRVLNEIRDRFTR